MTLMGDAVKRCWTISGGRCASGVDVHRWTPGHGRL